MAKHTHPSVCVIEGCGRPWYCREWCKPHYKRWERTGDTIADQPIRVVLPRHATTVDRFLQKVRMGGACWEWTGRRDRHGYGRFVANGQDQAAHRYAYELAGGVIPEGHEVCHRCDNPPCVRPDHLFTGTHAENMADMMTKGRKGKAKPKPSFVFGSSGVFYLPEPGTEWGKCG